MLGKFVPIILSLVQEKGGSGVKDLLGGVLKDMAVGIPI
jgi:hypothetical protein